MIPDVSTVNCCRSLYDLLDVSDFQVEGLRMEYYDRGDSWEGGFVFDKQTCAPPASRAVTYPCPCADSPLNCFGTGSSKTAGSVMNRCFFCPFLMRRNCATNVRKLTFAQCMHFARFVTAHCELCTMLGGCEHTGRFVLSLTLCLSVGIRLYGTKQTLPTWSLSVLWRTWCADSDALLGSALKHARKTFSRSYTTVNRTHGDFF